MTDLIISPTGKGVRYDPAGYGNFRARRGHRTHKGVDFLCDPGQRIVSPCDGRIIRMSYPYANDPKYLGVFIQSDWCDLKLWYFEPTEIGRKVKQGDEIGIAQDITQKYNDPRMKAHVHLQIELFDPMQLISEVQEKRWKHG